MDPVRRPRLPGFRDLRVIGRGGMGIVYRAWQEDIGRPVALKFIREGAHFDLEDLDRFRAEARILADVRHPNIVAIYHRGEHDGCPYFSMEFMEEGSLKERLEREEKQGIALDSREAARLIEVLARAVDHVHDRGVVHRDLKPANVLLAADGTAKIADFGLAKRLDGEGRHTTTGRIQGTPPYMAPEQAGGVVKRIGPATDVYALGAILYELLAGRPPFEGANDWEIIAQVLGKQPDSPRRYHPKLPRDLEVICLHCLKKEARDRYGDARALADDLLCFLEGRPLRHARKSGATQSFRRWCLRNPLAASLSGLLLLSLSAGLVGVAKQWVQDEQNSKEIKRVQVQAKSEAQKALEERTRSQRAQAQMMMHDGQDHCERQDSGRGMLLLAKGLRLAIDNKDKDLQRSFRILMGQWWGDVIPLKHFSEFSDFSSIGCRSDGRTLLVETVSGISWVQDVASGERLGPLRHNSSISASAFSPNGLRVLTGHSDGSVNLWDAKTGSRLGNYRHGGVVWTVGFSPDSRAAISGSEDRTARVWDVTTPEARPKILQHDVALRMVAFSPDGRFALTGGFGRVMPTGRLESDARVWEAGTGRDLGTLPGHLGSISSLAFGRGGSVALIGSEGSTDMPGEARLWNLETRTLVTGPLGHRGGVTAVDFSPDGQVVLTGSRDKTVRFWDSISGMPHGNPLEHETEVTKAMFNPVDGRTVLTGTGGGIARLWDATTREVIGQPLAIAGRVEAATFGLEGKTILVGGGFTGKGGYDVGLGEVRVWDTSRVTDGILRTEKDRASEMAANKASNDARWVSYLQHLASPRITASGMGSYSWSTVRSSNRHTEGAVSVAFSEDGSYALTRQADSVTIFVTRIFRDIGSFSLPDPSPGLDFRVPGRPVVLFDSTGITTISNMRNHSSTMGAVYDVNVIEFDNYLGRPFIRQNLAHDNPVTFIDLSADGRTLITGSNFHPISKCHVVMWRDFKNKPHSSKLELAGQLRTLALSRDGRKAMIGYEGFANTSKSLMGRAQLNLGLWEADTGKFVDSKIDIPGRILAISYMPDGFWIALVGNELLPGRDYRTAQIIDAVSGRMIGLPIAHQDNISVATFDPTGKLLLTGGRDNVGRLWDAGSGQPLGKLLVHKDWVTSVAISADGKSVMTGGRDGIARLRNIGAFGDMPFDEILTIVHVATGIYIDPTTNVFRKFDARAWLVRLRDLEALRRSNSP